MHPNFGKEMTMSRPLPESARPRLRKLIARIGARGSWQADLPRILMYHRVGESHDRLTVQPAVLAAQLDGLAAAGIEVTGVSDLQDRILKGERPRALALSFDDGYREMREIVAPLLLERGMGATFYVISGRLDGDIVDRNREFLTALEVSWLHAKGFEIGGHTHGHPVLTDIDETKAMAEIETCASSLNRLLGEAPRSFAYPRGSYGIGHAEMVRRAGFANAVTVRPGALAQGTPIHELPRTEIAGGDDLETFALKLAGGIDAWHRILNTRRIMGRLVERLTS